MCYLVIYHQHWITGEWSTVRADEHELCALCEGTIWIRCDN